MGRFTYFCASYWHRYNEPDSVAVIMQSPTWGVRDAKAQLEKVIREAMEEEFQRCMDEGDTIDDTEPDICWAGVHAMNPRHLFTAAELREHRQALQSGEVCWLARG